MDNRHPEIDKYAHHVYKFITQYAQVDEQEFSRYLPYLEIRSFSKKEQFLKYGQTDDYLNLVVEGLARKFVLVGKNEKTLQLATEGHIIQSELSFHNRLPSTAILEALEPTVLVSMNYQNVQYVLDHIPSAEALGRELVTYMFIKKDARYFAQLNNTTRQRFIHYLTTYPHMLQRVPQKILASYLEIKPETFSRLKHLLLKN